MEITKAIVTGGAGFIGSHVVDGLVVRGIPVVVYDNFSTGCREHLASHSANPGVQVVEGDVLDMARLSSAMKDCDGIFHFQANADVRGGIKNRRVDLEQNTIATWNVLECASRVGARLFAFASSATVYGEPTVFPTPEVCEMRQTSLYGASKLACEAMIEAYSEYLGFRAFTFRFVSWIGERYSHGVIYDFVRKLRANPSRLEILGNGKQTKSYLDVEDGTRGILLAIDRADRQKNLFNLGHDESINVMDLAQIVVEEMGLTQTTFECAGGERGWLGDSPQVRLDTARLKALGWTAQVPIRDSIRRTVRFLLSNRYMLDRD